MQPTRPHGAGRSGLTLIEIMFFGALAAIIVAGVVALLSRGSKLLEISRRASDAHVELRVLMEHMAEDVAELVYLLDETPYDSDSASSPLRFVIRSTRDERGITVPDTPSLRRVEYSAGPADPDTELRSCGRSVTLLKPDGSDGESSSRTLVRGMKQLRAWPVTAVPQDDGRYLLAPTTDPKARQPGATVACLTVDVTLGRAAGETSLERSPVTSVVTRLWCRNRVLELARGGLR